jgi:hypothetical protein
MSEFDIRRVVIACDVQDEIETAVREAAALAARWGVPVHGVFLQNENLRRLAELPFGRPVSLSSPGATPDFGTGELEALFSAFGAGMRRVLAEAAEAAGLDWSFAELRDVPSAASDALGEGDILVLKAYGGVHAGAWRPRSPWESVAHDLGGMVLLRRGEAGGRRRVVLVLGAASGDHARSFDAARALTQPRDEIALITIAAPEAGSDAALEPALAAAGIRPATIEQANGIADITARIAALDPRLIVVETAALASEALQALIAETRCDVLLVG